MKTYVFLFGKNKDLSKLELVSYLIKKNLKYNISKIIDEYAIIDIENFDFKKAINELGGTLKIAEFLDLNDLKIYKNKILYGMDFFYEDDEIIDELKTFFKKEKVKAFWKKPKKGNVFSPKESKKLDLELIVFKNKIAKVIANSNPAIFKERDENRPYFDKLKVTSLRLCKILINLSQVKENEILLDPFAGAGSILQEAMIMGINVIGIDIDPKSVDGTINNLNWIKNKLNLKAKFNIYNIDNKEADTIVSKVDCVVTEPYFGPFFKKIPKHEDVIKLVAELEKNYYALLKKLKNVVKDKGIIIFPAPVYKTSNGKVKVNFQNIINDIGYKIYTPLNNIKIPIKYSLKGSIVEREIFILRNL